jgi:hypothetical protein
MGRASRTPIQPLSRLDIRFTFKTPKKKLISLSHVENDSVTSKEPFLYQRTTPDGRALKRFAPGFYSDGETVYVDMGEFLETYGVCDLPEIRAVVWSDVREICAGVPVQELREKTSALPLRRR